MARPVLSAAQIDAFRDDATRVAMELFVEEGYERFSLRLLAKALGCSHTTPYRYFESKDEIFACARAEGFRRFAHALREAVAKDEAPLARLRNLGQAYLHFSQTQSTAFTLTFRMGQTTDAYPFVNEAAADAWQVVLETVDHAIRSGALQGQTNTVAHTMWASIHGIATLDLAQKLVMGRSASEVLDATLDALLRAHGARKEDTP